MKHSLKLCEVQEDYDIVGELLEAGWLIDPSITNGKPYALDFIMVFPLVLYESEEEKPKLEEKIGEFDDVEDFKDIPNSEVGEYLKQGYRIHIIYQKNTILIKRKVVEKK